MRRPLLLSGSPCAQHCSWCGCSGSSPGGTPLTLIHGRCRLHQRPQVRACARVGVQDLICSAAPQVAPVRRAQRVQLTGVKAGGRRSMLQPRATEMARCTQLSINTPRSHGMRGHACAATGRAPIGWVKACLSACPGRRRTQVAGGYGSYGRALMPGEQPGQHARQRGLGAAEVGGACADQGVGMRGWQKAAGLCVCGGGGGNPCSTTDIGCTDHCMRSDLRDGR